MPTLEDALELALQAHRGQQDKAGAPYILHPLRLMLRMEDETERMVALLHDVIEDSPFTLEDLRERGYSEEILRALDALTRHPEESYAEFIERAGQDAVARRVKLADLEDNMDLRRLAQLGPADAERLARYRAAWSSLRHRDQSGL